MVTLTKTERQAVLIVSGVILISIILKWFQPHVVHTDTFDYTLQDSLFAAGSKQDTTRDSLKHAITRPEVKHIRHTARKAIPKMKSIDLNSATEQQLEQLPRIGSSTAKAILEYREIHGPFKSINDLEKVKRVGPKTVELIAPYLFIREDSLNRVQ